MVYGTKKQLKSKSFRSFFKRNNNNDSNDNKNKSSLTSKKYMNHVLISMENETNLLAFENILNADIDKLLEQQEQETIDTYLLEDNND